MPGDDGVRLDDDEGGSPIWPEATEPCPENPIGCRQLRSLHGALQDSQPVTQSQNLKLQGRAAVERQHEGRKTRKEHATG
jgi:hypothetical protein